MHSCGVSIVILRTRSVLLVRRAKGAFEGRWSFPGGMIEPGETAAEAVRRELQEETGLQAVNATKLGRFRVSAKHGATELTVFYGRDTGGQPVAGDDAAAAVFIPYSEVLGRPHTPGLAGWISRALLRRTGFSAPRSHRFDGL